MANKEELIEKAKSLNEKEDYDGAMSALESITETDISSNEMELLNEIVMGKITSSSYGDEKKDACYTSLELLEKLKISKNAEWIESYESCLYCCFSKLNPFVRDEERNDVWLRLKEIYIELLLSARRVWKEKNQPQKLVLYESLSKLAKFYADVVDDDVLDVCSIAADEAKCLCKGTLDDDQYCIASIHINEIIKNIDTVREEKLSSREE